MHYYAIDFCSGIYAFHAFVIKGQGALSRRTSSINSILLLISAIIITWLKSQAEFDTSAQFVMPQ